MVTRISMPIENERKFVLTDDGDTGGAAWRKAPA